LQLVRLLGDSFLEMSKRRLFFVKMLKVEFDGFIMRMSVRRLSMERWSGRVEEMEKEDCVLVILILNVMRK
jgi:hypothetical protein